MIRVFIFYFFCLFFLLFGKYNNFLAEFDNDHMTIWTTKRVKDNQIRRLMTAIIRRQQMKMSKTALVHLQLHQRQILISFLVSNMEFAAKSTKKYELMLEK